MFLKLAWRNLWRNKRRTFITLTSVFFAVILSALMMSLKEGVYENMIETSVANYSGYAQIHAKGYWDEQTIDNSLEISSNLEKTLKNTKHLKGYLPRVENYALSATEENTRGATVVGVDPEKEKEYSALNERVVKGEYLNSEDDQVLIGAGLAEYLDVTVGDTIVLLGQGYHEISAAGKYSIKGIVKFGNPDLSKRLVFMPIKQAQFLFDVEGLYTSLILILDDPGNTDLVVNDIKKETSKDYEVMTWQELLPQLINMIETDRVEGYVFMFILYMVISFGMFGTTLMMMSERKREFGVLVAIGMKRMRLSVVVFFEIIIISIIGALLGVLGAFPVCYYFNVNPIRFGEEMSKMTEEYGMEAVLKASLSSEIFIQQAIIILIISTVIAVFPFIKLLRMNVIETMRK